MADNYSEIIARAALELKAIKLNPENPFQWASGYRMPIYNDNRLFLSSPDDRDTITNAITDFIEETLTEREVIVAGTSTAGIPWASLVADRLVEPMIYIRDKPKEHGMRNQIEGIDAEKDLGGLQVVVIEDLISTGGSSAAAVQAVREAKGICNHCYSIFNYGFNEAKEMFEGIRAYDKEGKKFLNPKCEIRSVLTYDILLKVAKDKGYLNSEQVKILEEWRENPWNWGEKRGFERVVKDKK